MSYRIKSVATLTGIPATTLRAWERRYELVAPRRTEGGYRVYSEEDIAALTQVKALVDRGYRVGEAIGMVRRGVGDLPPADAGPEALSGLRQALLHSLLELDRGRATEVYDRLAALPFDRQVEEVLLPLQREVGDGWAAGDVSVAQEHFASAFVRGRLVAMMEALSGGPRRGREAVCAGAPGELHEFGLVAAAVHLGMRGWRVTYLGADVPPAELGPVLEARRPRLLCTSLIVRRSEAECRELAAVLRAAAPAGTAVVVGGAGVPPGLPRALAPDTFLVRGLDELSRLRGLAAR